MIENVIKIVQSKNAIEKMRSKNAIQKCNSNVQSTDVTQKCDQQVGLTSAIN